MSLHESFWTYAGYRWLKVTAAILVAALVAYIGTAPVGGHNGGTWLGYTLGTVGAALILWLTWFGVRKRSYYSAGAPLRGWLSAHVYLGLGLILLVPLHSGFQFGWNVHTLAYVLMSLVILSGIFGVSVYTSLPRQMTENRPGEKLDALLQRIAQIDAITQNVAAELPDTVAAAVDVSVNETHIGGGILRQLSGRDPRCGTRRAVESIASELQSLAPAERERVQPVLEELGVKRTLLRRVRRDAQMKAMLDLWLVVHVPLAIATVAALATHVFVVFYYR